MLDELYNAKVLELAANIPRLGRLAAPHGTATAHSRLCGSTLTVDLILEAGTVADFGHEVRACALGQAAASIMAQHVIGATTDELRALRSQVAAMLTANGPPPDGRFGDVRYLEPVRGHRSRHASTLLAFDAVVAAIAQAEVVSPKPQIELMSLHQSQGVAELIEAVTWQVDQGRGEVAC